MKMTRGALGAFFTITDEYLSSGLSVMRLRAAGCVLSASAEQAIRERTPEMFLSDIRPGRKTKVWIFQIPKDNNARFTWSDIVARSIEKGYALPVDGPHKACLVCEHVARSAGEFRARGLSHVFIPWEKSDRLEIDIRTLRIEIIRREWDWREILSRRVGYVFTQAHV